MTDLNGIPNLRVDSAGEEVTYRLPVRTLGLIRLAGLLPIGFSAIWIGGLGRAFFPQLRHLTNHPQAFDYFICAFLFCFMAVGCGPALFGLAAIFGRTRIRWRNGRLTATEMLGPLGWPKKMSRGPIRKLTIVGGLKTRDGGSIAVGPLANLSALMAEFDQGPKRLVAMGYPRRWLEAVAQDLSSRAGISQGAAPEVEVLDGSQPRVAETVIEKPAGSPITLQHNADSIVVEVPPAGLWKGSMGLFFFGLVWCVIVGCITAAMLTAQPKSSLGLPFISIFWLVGLGMLAAGINLGRRRITLTAGPSELTAVKSGPFGVKRQTFRRTDIAAIGTGRSNIEVNHRFLTEVQVLLLTGKKAGFLAGRDPQELGWIATELRKAMGMAGQEGQPAAARPDWPAGFPGSFQKRNSPIGAVFALLFFGVIFFVFFWPNLKSTFSPRPNKLPARIIPPVKPIVPLKTGDGLPGVAFTSFGPSRSFGTNAWAIGKETHADWFIAEKSGDLKEIELAIAPGDGARKGKATVFLAGDRNGFPGATLESFSFKVNSHDGADQPEPVLLESVKHPALESGVKYWLCAKSPGGWAWYFNDQKIIQNSAREPGRNHWASAGDYTYACAFSVRVASRQPSPPSP